MTTPILPEVRDLLARGMRFILVDAVTGAIQDRNAHGKATRWSFHTRDAAQRNARRTGTVVVSRADIIHAC